MENLNSENVIKAEFKKQLLNKYHILKKWIQKKSQQEKLKSQKIIIKQKLENEKHLNYKKKILITIDLAIEIV
jgi:hypothetical protein